MGFPKRVGPAEIPTVIGTLLTFNQQFRITDVLLTNTSAVDRVVKVHLVTAGGAASASNEIVHTLVRGDDTLPLAMNVPVALGDFLRYVSAGAGINITLTYDDEKPSGGIGT